MAAAELLVTRPDSFDLFVFGTGLGMMSRDIQSYQRAYSHRYGYVMPHPDGVKIHSIWTTASFFQGWLGLSV